MMLSEGECCLVFGAGTENGGVLGVGIGIGMSHRLSPDLLRFPSNTFFVIFECN